MGRPCAQGFRVGFTRLILIFHLYLLPVFSIQTDAFAGYTRYLLKNEETGEFVAILPEYGALIQELVLANRDHIYPIIDGVAENELPGNMWYKSALLFPFPGRIKDGQYAFEGKEYHLPINETGRNSALHGLIADKPFQVLEADSSTDYARLKLHYEYNGQHEGYPFPFDFTVTYTLAERFQMEVAAQNTGNTNLPMGFGWHSYFKTGTVVDKLRLVLSSQKYHELDAFVVPTGIIKELDGFTSYSFLQGGNLIGNYEFDHGFTVDDSQAVVETLIHDSEQNVTICLLQPRSDGFDYTQVFAPSHRNSIAVEPQTCMANVFNNGLGLKILAPGDRWSGSVTIHLR